jgi:hypothetical protein
MVQFAGGIVTLISKRFATTGKQGVKFLTVREMSVKGV